MIDKLSKGMTVKCLSCDKPIVLTDETFTFDDIGEYIVCLECGKIFNVDAYIFKGEIID